MMRYVKPDSVISPRDFVRNVRVVFDGGLYSFSIAELEWEGGSAYGIRWNVARREWDDPEKAKGNIECKGMPTSRSYPVWFILPEKIPRLISQIIKDEKERLKEADV